MVILRTVQIDHQRGTVKHQLPHVHNRHRFSSLTAMANNSLASADVMGALISKRRPGRWPRVRDTQAKERVRFCAFLVDPQLNANFDVADFYAIQHRFRAEL
jgi:hypothetical protein